MVWKAPNCLLEKAILPKLIYRFSEIPRKIPVGYFKEIDKLILKFTWNTNDID